MSNVVAYYFSSPTCKPCKSLSPILEEIREEHPKYNDSNITWKYVNIQNDKSNLSGQFGIKVVPTIVVVVYDSTGKSLGEYRHSGTDLSAHFRNLDAGIRLKLSSSQ